MSIISNTTVISNFAATDRLELLRHLFGSLYLSTPVYDEIHDGLEEGDLFYSGIERWIHPFHEDGWLRLTGVSDEAEIGLLHQLPVGLHAGEASCIAIAQHRSWIFLTDDNAARRESQKRGVRVSGTIGCLVLGVERHLMGNEEADRLLAEMIRMGYRSPVSGLHGLVRQDT